MCLLRNLSYQVHREVPGHERYLEAAPLNQGPAPGANKASCFGSRKGKGQSQVSPSGAPWRDAERERGERENERLQGAMLSLERIAPPKYVFEIVGGAGLGFGLVDGIGLCLEGGGGTPL